MLLLLFLNRNLIFGGLTEAVISLRELNLIYRFCSRIKDLASKKLINLCLVSTGFTKCFVVLLKIEANVYHSPPKYTSKTGQHIEFLFCIIFFPSDLMSPKWCLLGSERKWDRRSCEVQTWFTNKVPQSFMTFSIFFLRLVEGREVCLDCFQMSL